MTRVGKKRGYTATEVLVSLAIVAIGGAGVISMQRATIQGNIDARRIDMANAIARQWIERLRTDAMLWTLPAAQNPNSNFANALLLQRVDLNDDIWYRPDQRLAADPKWSPGMDVLGADVTDSTELGDQKNRFALFCTNVRLKWLIVNQVMRVDIRVFWPRGVGASPDDHYCAQTPPADMETRTDKYHFIYATTAIRRNAVQ
jgi:prepilin-type N-terminal cleavage/methylation domain-containing protein